MADQDRVMVRTQRFEMRQPDRCPCPDVVGKRFVGDVQAKCRQFAREPRQPDVAGGAAAVAVNQDRPRGAARLARCQGVDYRGEPWADIVAFAGPVPTIGSYLSHRFNPELGIGRVISIDRRTITVEFPRTATTLRFAANTDALVPVDLRIGRPVRIVATGEESAIKSVDPGGTLTLTDGRTLEAHSLWPLELEGALLERLATGHLDDVDDFVTRMNILHLLGVREAGGLGSFLGGRVRLYPHQLYVAERASAVDPVRWLLADEVGLGKTIEASLILNRLVHAGKAERCLVVAPDALTVQWLGELWRKYHQVFTLLDAQRLADVA